MSAETTPGTRRGTHTSFHQVSVGVPRFAVGRPPRISGEIRGFFVFPVTTGMHREPRLRGGAMKVPRTPLTIAALLLTGSAGVMLGAAQHPDPRSCTDPATGDRVVAGDAIRNDGQDYVCTDGTLVIMSGYGKQVVHKLPHGFWWRTVTGHIGDCGPHALPRKHPAVIVGYGPGDDTSALICPPRPWGNGTANPS